MPVLIPVFGAIGAGITSAIAAFSGLVGGFAGITAFLTSPIGALILGVGLQLVLGPLLARKKNAPSAEAGKVNVRIAEAERWIVAGLRRQGGAIVFAEFDSTGAFWYVVVHADSLVGTITKRYFDDVEIQVDGSNDVITDEFCMDAEKNIYPGTGTKYKYFRVWTQTHTEAAPTPPGLADLMAAFPGASGWTTDHKLIGTTYSVVRMLPLQSDIRYKIYRWRGPVGIGEPSISIVAEWSKVFDPNDGTQTNGTPSTYKFSKNAVLVWAWFRTHRYGRNKARSSINWTKVGEQALIAAQNVTDLNGNIAPRYNCGISVPDSKTRSDAEQEILATMDAQLVFDDDGKCWPRVGYWYEPTLKLTRNRDIAGMESVEAQNGESETNGVIVRFTDPNGKYLAQPSAPWVNPLYYVPGELPKYLTVDILGVDNHNQAMRLAKAIGMRSQSAYKILPTVGLRGLKMRQERIVDIVYDNTFAGDHEIVTPVEVDKVGIFCGAGMVPVDADRWTLLAGEEKQPPVYTDAGTTSLPVLPVSVTLSYSSNQIFAVFPTPPRADVRYIFEMKRTADANWLAMGVNMDLLFAYRAVTPDNQEYQVRYKAVSASGRSSAWITPIPTIYASVIIISGTPVLTGQVGIAYAGFTVTGSGGVAPRVFSDFGGRLPPGITINSSTGVVAGTPSVAGTYTGITLRCQDTNFNLNYLTPFTIVIIP